MNAYDAWTIASLPGTPFENKVLEIEIIVKVMVESVQQRKTMLSSLEDENTYLKKTRKELKRKYGERTTVMDSGVQSW